MVLISSKKMAVLSKFTDIYTLFLRFFSKFLSNSAAVSALITILVLCIAGCQTTPPSDPYAPQVVTDLIARPFLAGESVQNRPIEVLILGNGDDVIFILATIHGDEPAGTLLVERLSEYLMQNRYLLDNRKVIILPVANPDGLAKRSRYNANGVDLNRNFTATNRVNIPKYGKSALSEPESQIIYQIINQYTPDRIITIHQPLACVDYDGPSLPLAVHMGRCCELPVRRIGAQPGSLGSYAGLTLNTPIITLELKSEDSKLSSEELWDEYGAAILAAVTYPARYK
jgi:protein MpaA